MDAINDLSSVPTYRSVLLISSYILQLAHEILRSFAKATLLDCR